MLARPGGEGGLAVAGVPVSSRGRSVMRPSGPVTDPPAGTQVPPDQMSRLTGTPAAGRPAVRSRMCVETLVMP